MPASTKRQKRREKSPAARARKAAGRYLTPIVTSADVIVGYRFAPGPHLRARGLASKILRHDDGRYFSEAEAQAYRDAAVAGDAARCVLQPTPSPAKPITLRELWTRYETQMKAAIEKNAKLEATQRDDDVIAPATLRFYRSMIKPWIDFAHDDDTREDLPAAALDADTIKEEYKNQKASHGHHRAHASYRALLALLAYGVRIKALPTNEAKGMGLKRPRGRLRLGTPEEIRALVEAADAIDELETLNGASGRVIADAIVAALWTGQRQQDLLACDLALQLQGDFLIFARTHGGDFSQQKVRGRVDEGGQANVKVLPPLRLRLRGRTEGQLVPAPHGGRWNADTFRHAFAEVRAVAAKKCASVADLQFRDLRDTAVTRLHLAKVGIADIALWTGHSLKTIEQILQEHYLVSTREAAEGVGEQIEAWRQKTGVMW